MLAAPIFTQLSPGQTFSRSFSVFVEQWPLFLTLACSVFIPLSLLAATVVDLIIKAATAAARKSFDDQSSREEFRGQVASRLKGSFGIIAIEGLVYIFVAIVAQASICHVVAEIYLRRSPTAFKSVTRGLSQMFGILSTGCTVHASALLAVAFGDLIATVFAMPGITILTVVGDLCAAGIMVSVVYMYSASVLLYPVVMIEQKGPIAALKRSWELAHSKRCLLFHASSVGVTLGLLGKCGLIYALVLRGNPTVPLSNFGTLMMTFPFLVFFPISGMYVFRCASLRLRRQHDLFSLVCLSFACLSLSTVVYLNIRVEREHLSRDTLLHEVGGDAAVVWGKSDMTKPLVDSV